MNEAMNMPLYLPLPNLPYLSLLIKSRILLGYFNIIFLHY